MADLQLIRQSAEELAWLHTRITPRTPLNGILYLPRPGCGNGGRSWAEVKPVIGGILGEQFVVVERRFRQLCKLDAKFYGEIRKAKDDSVVPDDEYVVFLAKDNAFAEVLPDYLNACIELGCDAVQIDSVRRMIARATEWRKANPARLKKPDAAGEKLLDTE